MPEFDNNHLQLDTDGKWVFDDGNNQAVFEPDEMEQIMTPESHSDEEIEEIAKGIMSHDIFCSDQCSSDILHSVFMLLVFMNEKQLIEFSLRNITFFYEKISKAGPSSVNGCPIFFSCRMLNRDDHDRLRNKLRSLGAYNAEESDGQADG